MAFPNVPIAPGVPPLLRNPVGSALSIALLVRDALELFGITPPRWGIFQDGAPVVEAETIVDFGYRQTWRVADYPIEQGGFETYDKVATPFDARVRLASGGSAFSRQELLESVEAIADTVELYDVVTPDRVYQNCNVTHYDYRRTATNGAGMIIIDLWLVEVRVAGATAFSSTKSASAADPSHAGIVQPSSFDEAGFTTETLTRIT